MKPVSSGVVFDFAGRNVVVTGGSRGIGSAIVEGFARARARTAFCHLGDMVFAEDLIGRLSADDLEVHAHECDVADEEQVREFRRWADTTIGSADVLVNCAGIGQAVPFSATTSAAWDRMMAVNLRGAFLMTQAFYPGMAERGYGRIVNISSQLAYKGDAQLVHYCAAKAGLLGFTRALAREAAPKGVLINAVAPGPVETEMLRSLPEDWRRTKAEDLPAKRFAEPDEIVPSVLLLCSDAGRYYIGQTLSPNGGDVMF